MHLPMPGSWRRLLGQELPVLTCSSSEFFFDNLASAPRAPGDGKNFAPAVLHQTDPAHLAALLPRGCLGRNAGTYAAGTEPLLVLRSRLALAILCRLHIFVANWVYAVLGTTHSDCAPLWTVSIEEQFYLVWPALMKMLRRRGMIIAGVVTFLLATINQLALVLGGASAGYAYYGSTARCESLALGILLALFVDRLPRLPGTYASCWLPAG